MRYFWTVFWLLGAAAEALLAAHYQHRSFALLGLLSLGMAAWNMRRTAWYRSLVAWYTEAL